MRNLVSAQENPAEGRRDRGGRNSAPGMACTAKCSWPKTLKGTEGERVVGASGGHSKVWPKDFILRRAAGAASRRAQAARELGRRGPYARRIATTHCRD